MIVSSNIKTINKVFLIIIIALIVLVSCDPMSSVEYRIINLSHKNTVIEFKEGFYYNVHHEDSTNFYYSTDNRTAVLKHNEFISIYYEWINPTVESHTPLWMELQDIQMEDSIVPREYWNNPKSWQKSGDKGIMGGEEIKYNLFLQDFSESSR